MAAVIKLSVRELVEFVQKSGSIDSRFSGTDRASEGSRIHRRLQKAAGEGYNAEVTLKGIRTLGIISYVLDGRADGIFIEDGETVLEEIKTTSSRKETLTADFCPAHWAQAECYGAFYCAEHDIANMTVQLTYYQIDTDEIVQHRKAYTKAELEEKLMYYLTLYEPFAMQTLNHAPKRSESIAKLQFPFGTYRSGQYELARAVYRTISANARLAAIAPTGIGKTISTVFPAIKAMGEGKIDRIFYLTAKTVTRKAANDAIDILKSEQSLDIYRLTLTAKDKICLLDERDCTPLACPYALDYYDRINPALLEILGKYKDFTQENITTLAKEYRLCPFELALDLSLFCDVIICDYNYLFDPVVSLQRFFGKDGGDYSFLIDEAHNLGDRARSMYSASLCKSAFYDIKKVLGKGKAISRTLNAINTYFISARKESSGEHNIVSPAIDEKFTRLISDFTGKCSEWLDDNKQHELHSKMLSLYFDARFFLRIAEVYDEHFTSITSVSSAGVRVELYCLDASCFIDASLALGKASVLFSATLYPLEYYKRTLGIADCKRIILDSPFDTGNMCLMSCVDISTKYNDRADTLDEVCAIIFACVSAKKGNYIVYFPSYKYLSDVRERYSELYPSCDISVQDSAMDEQMREDFLGLFTDAEDEAVLAFCVLGGIFSEGIDLAGERLIGSIIVGVGMPQISLRQNTLKEYYDATMSDGFEYAYTYPGFNKVLQAAGRVIRTPTDKGVVLLIDTRYASNRYKQLFPCHWQGAREVKGLEEVKQVLENFWQ